MPTLIKRSNGIYYVILTDDHGRRKWISTGERKQSLALNKLDHLALRDTAVEKRLTLEEFYREFIAYSTAVLSSASIGIYERAFKKFIESVGSIPLRAVSQRHVDLFKAKRLGEIRKVTLNIELRSLKAAFHTASRWKLIDENPFTGVKLCAVDEDPPLYFSVEDFHAILAVINVAWLRDIVIVAVLTGMRRGELLSLRWSNIDFDRRLISIHSQGNFRTKLGKRRTIPLNSQVVEILRRRFTERKGECVFHADGECISGRRLSKYFKRCVRRARLNERLHFHSLRHSFASWLVKGNISIYQVQKLLGHSNIRVTEIYSHLLPETMHDTVETLSIKLPVQEGEHLI